jgi:hypothetical protein
VNDGRGGTQHVDDHGDTVREPLGGDEGRREVDVNLAGRHAESLIGARASCLWLLLQGNVLISSEPVRPVQEHVDAGFRRIDLGQVGVTIAVEVGRNQTAARRADLLVRREGAVALTATGQSIPLRLRRAREEVSPSGGIRPPALVVLHLEEVQAG